MSEEKTIVYSYNKDTKIYTIDYKEMQKINRKLKERFTLKQENKQLKDKLKDVQEERDYLFNKTSVENKYLTKENKQLKEKEELHLNRIDELTDRVVDLKSVIEEVREIIEKGLDFDNPYYADKCEEELLQILDKAKDVK